jgi:hypothetical protein
LLGLGVHLAHGFDDEAGSVYAEEEMNECNHEAGREESDFGNPGSSIGAVEVFSVSLHFHWEYQCL